MASSNSSKQRCSNTEVVDLTSQEVSASDSTTSAVPTHTVDTELAHSTDLAVALTMVLQREAIEDIPKFTGDHGQNALQFINMIERVGMLTKISINGLFSLTLMKLGGRALDWYDNNRIDIIDWFSLKTHLLNRFHPSPTDALNRLLDRHQLPGESINTYYDDVISISKQSNPELPLSIIVQLLQRGVLEPLKTHINRRLKSITEPLTPSLFLKVALDEEDVLCSSSVDTSTTYTTPPYFAPQLASPGTFTPSPYSHNNMPTALQTPFTYIPHQRFTTPRTLSTYQRNPHQPCLVCLQFTHRTMNCPRRYLRGCFKCGRFDHTVRYCNQNFY